MWALGGSFDANMDGATLMQQCYGCKPVAPARIELATSHCQQGPLVSSGCEVAALADLCQKQEHGPQTQNPKALKPKKYRGTPSSPNLLKCQISISARTHDDGQGGGIKSENCTPNDIWLYTEKETATVSKIEHQPSRCRCRSPTPSAKAVKRD